MKTRRLKFEYLEQREMLHGGNATELWKTTFGSTTDLRSDANDNGVVDAADYTVLRDGAIHDHPDPIDMPLPDVTGDGLVDGSDVRLVVRQWGQHTPLGDATGDGIVSSLDLLAIIQSRDDVPHGDSPEKQQEHLDLMKLFPPMESDAMAVRSGVWSDPLIWHNGKVPTAGQAVWIPAWYSVEVDDVLTVPLRWVRVDGTLSFSEHVDSQLVVDTLMGSPTGHLHINTTDADVSTRIVIADTGPIDTTWDTRAISRGIVWHGSAEIHGAEKTPYATLAVDPVAGDDTLHFAEPVVNWQPGDVLVLPGQNAKANEDDKVTIAGVSEDGLSVTVTQALAFTHPTLRNDGGEVSVAPIVANYTRNVSVSSENANDITRRGHIMFMHSNQINISYAGFYELGRTDKSQVMTDPDGEGNGLENPRARYAVHFHRAGGTKDGLPATMRGSAVIGSPGHGIVNHSSNVLVEDNVTYNIFGSHYFTEIGDELGTFRRNVAIRSTGDPTEATPSQGRRNRNQDFGHAGHGFWIQSAGRVTVEDNIAAGHASAAFIFLGSGPQIPVAELEDPSIVKPDATGSIPTTIASNALPVNFKGNVSFASELAFEHWGIDSVGGSNQRQSSVHGLVEDSTFFGRVKAMYGGGLHFRNVNIIGDVENPINAQGFGSNDAFNDAIFENVRVEGWRVGIAMPNGSPVGSTSRVIGGYLNNVINIAIANYWTSQAPLIHEIEGVTFGVMPGVKQYDIWMSTPGQFASRLSYENRGWWSLFDNDQTVRPHPDSRVVVNGRYLFAPAFGIDAILNLSGTPEEFKVSNRQLQELYALYFGTMKMPDEITDGPRTNGFYSTERPTIIPQLTLLSPRVTNDESYILEVKDSAGEKISLDVKLKLGWNVVQVMADGVERGVLVKREPK